MPEENTEAKLIALTLAGDQDAFGLLIMRYQPMALRLALQLTKNQDIAHELVQDAMVQAYLSLDQLRDMTRFRSWFYGIVLNVCHSYLRAQKLRQISLEALLTETLYAEAGFPAEFEPESANQRDRRIWYSTSRLTTAWANASVSRPCFGRKRSGPGGACAYRFRGNTKISSSTATSSITCA